ncbi:hypothetical protein [Pseudobacillus badius]|uniref:hypothetical protein n=1 Tax=Bacillus badius TaxID=1455 RepID=UPI0007B09893|nr:hypothetical protein [Bacillus badius]OCS83561.1 hypothetical protein A6M11_05760 [Bacillus badius]OVE53154.1 hypothetical protein B1A98_06130 [Bacillus badius]TDW05207.1 hypothetical protein B0G66_102650 [Bacillus badius]
MGYPNIPDITPDITIDRVEVINLLLASIGLEELSLAHLVNAEAEKLQAALGTLILPDDTAAAPLATTLEDLLTVNRDVTRMLKFAMHKEFILLAKLEDVIDFAEEFTPPTPPVACACSVALPDTAIAATLELPIGGGVTVDVPGMLVLGFTLCDCDTGASTLAALFLPTTPGGPIPALITASLVPGSVAVANCDGTTATVTLQITAPPFFPAPLEVTLIANETAGTVTIIIPELGVEETVANLPVTVTECGA